MAFTPPPNLLSETWSMSGIQDYNVSLVDPVAGFYWLICHPTLLLVVLQYPPLRYIDTFGARYVKLVHDYHPCQMINKIYNNFFSPPSHGPGYFLVSGSESPSMLGFV